MAQGGNPKRVSLVFPIILITIGALFLFRNWRPGFDPVPILWTYWPLILILSASERYGIICKEGAIPTRLQESPSAPPLVRSPLSSCWSCCSGTDAAIPVAMASIPGHSTTPKLWSCREQSRRTPGWKSAQVSSLSTAAQVTCLKRTSPIVIHSMPHGSTTAWPAALANSTFLKSPTPCTSAARKTIGIYISARNSRWS